jgi:hypothetical protein
MRFSRSTLTTLSSFALGGAYLLSRSSYASQNQISSCEEGTKNSAFVFIKPHANTLKTQQLVSQFFQSKDINVLQEGELTGEIIDRDRLIDQHYYAIASKATLMKPNQLPVPAEKFQQAFGLDWNQALNDGKVFNALDACAHLGITADQLDAAWGPAKKVKFGGGFYCGKVEIEGKEPIFVFNGFFMAMRSKFVTPGTSIHYYVVEFSPSELPWSEFRGQVLGPTDPEQAPADSLRGLILNHWEILDLGYKPNVGDNGVHASASPFEALAERNNWLKVPIEEDSFGQKLLESGLSKETIQKWSVDPQVKGKSLFDSLEDLDSDACVAKAVELNKE